MADPDHAAPVEVDDVDPDAVLIERHGAVVVYTLHRPARRNAINYGMLNRYFDLLDEADADESVRAIVVTGAGGHFSVGVDAESLAVTSSQGLRRRPAKNRRMTHAMSVRKPMIAAIEGSCAGFGLVQALHCDVRFAGGAAVFATAFVRRGLNAEYGASWLLPRIVGLGRATELLVSGRRFDAAEAERIGLVNWVTESGGALERALAYAADVAENCSPVAIAATKLQLRTDWLRTHDDADDYSKALSHRGNNRVDFAEGVRSYIEKRPPQFAPLAPEMP